MASGTCRTDPLSTGSDKNPRPPSPIDHHTERRKEASRRRRNPLSCAECRRLKLRCDRVFPCESCRKRGCATICPEGALTTKGTRFVLANTEELHAKIISMSERIRQLEDAIAASHSSPEPHPLLQDDLLLIKIPTEFKNDDETKSLKQASPLGSPEDNATIPEMVTAFGTLKIGDNGSSKFFGQTARTENFLEDDKETVRLEIAKARNSVPPDILHICQAFPFGALSEEHQLSRRIASFLPPYDEGWRLAENYFSHASFMYIPCQREDFPEIFRHVYDHMQYPERLNKHRLALVFAILAHGALADLSMEPYSTYAEQFQLLSRASLAITTFLAEPSIHAIQTLHLLALYSALSNKPDGGAIGWVIQGLNANLAKALGLHRDLETMGAAEEDKAQVEVRRWVFWEMVTLEGWLCLGLGRPPTLHFSQFDCKLPSATQRALDVPDSSLHTWHTWKHGLARFVIRVLQKALDTRTPSYSEILDLDRNLHKYPMPPDLENMARGLPIPEPTPEQTPGLTMERTLLLTARYTAVLLLHRGYFAQALSERNDPMQSKYAPSVLASYRSACFIIMALYTAYEKHPELTCRFGLYWSNAFSATISLCLLVTRATKSSYAPLALEHLDVAYDLLQKAAPVCYPASKALPMAKKLYEKAHAAFAPYGDGQHPASIAYRRSGQDDDEDDELNVLGGRTNIVSDKSTQRSSTGVRAPRSPLNYPESPGMPLEMPPMNHLDSVHPSLMQYVAESPWVPRGQQLVEGYARAPALLTSAQQSVPTLELDPHLGSYPYSGNLAAPQQGYHTYTTYQSGSNVHPAATVGEVSSTDPHYAYYSQPYTPEGQGQGAAGPRQPDNFENQYATWQTYVQQLYN